MRREERVTVQGPVKEQQPDGMSHRGREGRLRDPRVCVPKWGQQVLPFAAFDFPAEARAQGAVPWLRTGRFGGPMCPPPGGGGVGGCDSSGLGTPTSPHPPPPRGLWPPVSCQRCRPRSPHLDHPAPSIDPDPPPPQSPSQNPQSKPPPPPPPAIRATVSGGGGGGMAWPASPVATGCQGNPCSTGIRWGVSPAAQMGCLRNRSGSPSGADQP